MNKNPPSLTPEDKTSAEEKAKNFLQSLESRPSKDIQIKTSSRAKPRYLPFALALFFLLAISATLFFIFKKQIQEKIVLLRLPTLSTKKEETSQASESSNLEVAEQILAWLATQKNDEGFYNYGVRCPQKGSCSQPNRDGRSGLAVLWAYYQHYQKTKTPEDLGKINYLLDLYTNPDKIPYIQNVFWNCKLMYPLWQADFFSNKQKEKIKKICWQMGAYYPPLEQEWQEKIAQGELKELEEVISQGKKIPALNQEKTLDEINMYFVRYSAYASDFAVRYSWQNDPQDLKNAQGYFYHAVDLWRQAPSGKFLEGECLLGIAALDLYQASQEQKYLQFAIALAQNSCLKKIENLWEESCRFSLLEAISCGLLVHDLSDTASDESFKSAKTTLIDNLKEHNFDGQGHSGYTRGFGAFYLEETFAEPKTLYYYVRENGLLVDLLLAD